MRSTESTRIPSPGSGGWRGWFRRPAGAVASIGLAIVAGVFGRPAPAGAQLAPESPRMLGPATPSGFAVHLLRADALPGDGDGLLAQWQPPGLPDGVWLRGGAGTGAGGEDAFFGGVDVRAALLERASLRLAWVGGLGASSGSWTLLTLPMGVQAGPVWSAGSVWLAPWVGAGLVMEYRLGDEAPEEAFDAYPSAEVGAELSLDPGRRVLLRVAAGLGDRQAVALGVMVRTGGE